MDGKIKLYDLYGVWYKPFWHTAWFLYSIAFLGLVVVGLLLLFLVWYWKKRSRPTIPYWQRVLDELKSINMSLYEDPSMHESFYVRLTVLLKSYLSKRYGHDFLSCTDREVIGLISDLPVTVVLKKRLRAIFDGLEVIKFAHKQAATEKMKYDLISSIEIVHETILSSQSGESVKGG